jgi:2,4-dienoyl-CoA reductase-like NADH-dependent reductase (Old Yellow Enzyme family)
MADLRVLLKPFKLKGLTLKNRIVSTPHAPAYARDGMPQERYQLYHEEKAKGGVGLVMFGGSSTIAPECPATFGQLCVDDDRIIPFFREFSDRIHRHGATTICQISHMGRRTRWDVGDWLAPISASPVWEPDHQAFPKEMEDWDFKRVIDAFAAGALRCKMGGLDGVELSFNSLHLIPQFWSPSVNQRQDGYGGSLENRMRLSYQVVDAVRDAVGEEFVVGVRLSVDELIEDGLSDAECREIGVKLAATGKVDYFNTQGSQPRDFPSLAVNMAGMAFPVAPFLHLASALRAASGIPVMQAHRINDLNTAAMAIEEGHLDLVGLTRMHIADPHIVRKLQEGRVDDIRQCVGANYCIDRIYFGKEALCIQNAATGREATMPHALTRARRRKKAVVIGGGPGGLEAARVCAERGHAVVLFERSDQVGGQINLAARASWRESLSGIVRWLGGQVQKLAVDLRLTTPASAELVFAENPDIVIVATGGRPNKGRFKGAELAVSTWDILSGKVGAGDSVLLYDDNDSHQGPSCAEMLAQKGAKLEIATPDRIIGRAIGGTNFPTHLRNLYKADVIISPDLKLTEVYREGNKTVPVLRNIYSDRVEERAVDQVVAEHGTLPNDELYFALKPHSSNLGEVDYYALRDARRQAVISNLDGRFVLYRVGDAVASRNIHAAIYDSLRLCKDL